jgi:phosphoribosylformylglycinamidine cyclo-ligase
VREGDMLIGLPSSGLHSNGFSLVRKALNKTMRTRYVRELLTPTRLYVRPALAACTRFRIAQIAHVTGGSFLKKLPKVIRPGYEFVLYKGSWNTQEIFSVIQKQAHLSFEEMYSTFNMGIGMIMVVSRKEHEALLRFLHTRYKLNAAVIGTVRRGNRKVLFV